MKKRGRKRSSKNFPPQITNPDQLPDHVWFNTSGAGKWMLDYWDVATNKKRAMRICSAEASLSEIWLASSAALENKLIITFDKLSTDFQKSIAWSDLAKSTRDDYKGCHKKIVSVKIAGQLLGAISIEKWSVGLVRKYRDHRGKESRSRANKELSYIKRVFNWSYEYEKVKFNPAKNISKLKVSARQHYALDEDYTFLLKVAKESSYWYLPYMIELAYLCRMRLCEVTDFTDADGLEKGLFIRRRKGSKNNIVNWTPQLKKLWDEAKSIRNSILSKRKQPQKIKANERQVFISERTGNKLQPSSVKTAKNRIDKLTMKKAEKEGVEYTHFYFHDLKRKGISDTKGDKLEASGHRDPKMLATYDVLPPVVNSAGE